MQPETIFILALAVAVVVIVLAIRKTRQRRESREDALDIAFSDLSWPDWW